MKPEPYVDLLKTILTWMITRPEFLRFDVVPTSAGISLGVHCHVDDYRFIIGKKGRAVRALQTIFSVIGQASGQKISISVSDPGGLRNEGTVIPPMSWERDKEIGALFERTLKASSFYGAKVLPQSAGNKTVLTVHPGKFVPEELHEALEIIFRAMGRMNGRYVELDVR